jgi:nitrate/nitrite-specific signal transduction histidine kinase
MLATVQDENLARKHMDAAITASIGLRQGILDAGRLMRDHIAGEAHATVVWFRFVVLGLAIIFLLVINLSVLLLMRMGNMILKPVDALVDASRHLAREEFDYRVAQQLGATEFSELATAFNRMAEGLQASERRKLETLSQTAIMLNHELNNASAIIKLQLKLLERQSEGNPTFERCLRQIHDSLSRMTGTLEALKRVRRIVLTDYTPETKMLDLEKSVQG